MITVSNLMNKKNILKKTLCLFAGLATIICIFSLCFNSFINSNFIKQKLKGKLETSTKLKFKCKECNLSLFSGIKVKEFSYSPQETKKRYTTFYAKELNLTYNHLFFLRDLPPLKNFNVKNSLLEFHKSAKKSKSEVDTVRTIISFIAGAPKIKSKKSKKDGKYEDLAKHWFRDLYTDAIATPNNRPSICSTAMFENLTIKVHRSNKVKNLTFKDIDIHYKENEPIKLTCQHIYNDFETISDNANFYFNKENSFLKTIEGNLFGGTIKSTTQVTKVKNAADTFKAKTIIKDADIIKILKTFDSQKIIRKLKGTAHFELNSRGNVTSPDKGKIDGKFKFDPIEETYTKKIFKYYTPFSRKKGFHS